MAKPDLDDPTPDPGDQEKLKQDLEEAQERARALEAQVKELRSESASRRIAAREANEALEARTAELAELEKQIEGKLPETEQKVRSLERQLAESRKDSEAIKARHAKLLGVYKTAQVEAQAAPLVEKALAEQWRESATELMKIRSKVDPESNEVYIEHDGQRLGLPEWLTVWIDSKGDGVRKPTQKGRGSETPRSAEGVIPTKDKEPDMAMPMNVHHQQVKEYLDEMDG